MCIRDRYLRTLFKDSPVGRAKSILTIHNLRFQGVYNIPTIKYWSGLPDSVFNMGALQQDYVEANMLKGGLAYADRITTVSGTYAYEIQTPEYLSLIHICPTACAASPTSSARAS